MRILSLFMSFCIYYVNIQSLFRLSSGHPCWNADVILFRVSPSIVRAFFRFRIYLHCVYCCARTSNVMGRGQEAIITTFFDQAPDWKKGCLRFFTSGDKAKVFSLLWKINIFVKMTKSGTDPLELRYFKLVDLQWEHVQNAYIVTLWILIAAVAKICRFICTVKS